jgi:MerR family transcriptional regulator, copper efflux regulator
LLAAGCLLAGGMGGGGAVDGALYERAGLLSPARRAANGYRVFDESALDELAFISRAKGIGMSLEDIADLVASWPVGERRSLQARPAL